MTETWALRLPLGVWLRLIELGQFNGHELGQTPGDGEGQGRLACCRPWGLEESDTTWRLNSGNKDGWGKWGQGQQEPHPQPADWGWLSSQSVCFQSTCSQAGRLWSLFSLDMCRSSLWSKVLDLWGEFRDRIPPPHPIWYKAILERDSVMSTWRLSYFGVLMLP